MSRTSRLLGFAPLLLLTACQPAPTPTPGCPDDDVDCDGVVADLDCDDSDPDVSPERGERCDGKDTNCDGAIDEGFDQDGDGVTTCAGDCDDGEPTTYSGAVDLCEDGVDNDCNGLVDDGPDDDADGDGVCTPKDCDDADPLVSPLVTEVCDGADQNCDGVIDEGFDEDTDGVTTCAGDCDDNNSEVYPGAAEQCDGLDGDCDGTPDSPFDDTDDDADGAALCHGGDCDDTDPTAFPGGFEIPDGADDDCDGLIDEGWQGDGGIELLVTGFSGAETLSAMGSVVSQPGDVNGDGLSDFLISSSQHDQNRGRAHLFLGQAFDLASPPAALTPAVTIDGEVEGAQLGAALALVDLDNDGFDDVVLGSPGGGPGIGPEGAVRIFWGGANLSPGSWDPDDADVLILGSYGVERCGAALANAGDMDGDGRSDLAIGCPWYTTPDGLVGRTVVFAGRVRAAWGSAGGSADAELIVIGSGSEVNSGAVLAGGLDANGDGKADLLIGSPNYANDRGRVGLKLGEATFEGVIDLDDVERIYEGASADELGSFLGWGDLDGDGLDDALLGAPGFSGVGRILVVPGQDPPRASGDADTRSDWSVVGGTGDQVGTSAAVVDLTGDGIADLVVGSPEWVGPLGGAQGRVAILQGPVQVGTLSPATSTARLLGEAGGDSLGHSVIPLPDATGDGQPDLLVTAPYSDSAASNGGRITLVPGFP